MEASSFDESQEQLDTHNVSLNETANSIHFDYGQKDKEMLEVNNILIAYISEKLIVNIDFSFETIQNNPIICKHKHQVIKPIPNVYFLPSTVLFSNQKTYRLADLQAIKEYLQQLKREDCQLRLNRQKKELNFIIHNQLELLFYNMRVNYSESSLHKDPRMLDSKYLIDKLFEYYQKFYAKLYFRETSILILYWAYQHDLLDTAISQQALKLIIICNFINFGYGVKNILVVQSNNQEKLKMNKKMNSYMKINTKGETQILQGLTTQFFNYTILQKRGFYLVSKKKFMQIKDIIPVMFPVLPLSYDEERKIRTDVSKDIRGPLQHPTQTMSICKNISKIFRFLHNKFEKPMKLVIDFNEHSAYRSQFASTFELEVMHPVLNTVILKMKDGEIKQLKRQVNHVHQKFMKNEQPLQIMMFLMQKTRR